VGTAGKVEWKQTPVHLCGEILGFRRCDITRNDALSFQSSPAPR
jgi:hypothetical protein